MYTVQVLLSTYNGETYLAEQLDSILAQKEVNVKLLIRDDGSIDETTEILRTYASVHENIRYFCGENCGVVASYFRLFECADPEVDFYAFADQDDVWDADKLSIACQKLEEMRQSDSEAEAVIPEKKEEKEQSANNKKRGKKKKKKNTVAEQPAPIPAEAEPALPPLRTYQKPLLYCCDALNTDEELNPLPESMQTAGKSKIPDFRNALIENIARGGSIVFNHALMAYVRIPMPADIYMHDWWLYLVASCFGEVYYDEQSHYSYRQHGGNVLGAAAPSGSGKFFRRLKQSKTNAGHISRQAKTFQRIYRVPQDKETYLNIVTKYRDVKKYRQMGKSGQYLFRQDPKDQKIFKLMFYSNHI